jgi:hypothetical protein
VVWQIAPADLRATSSAKRASALEAQPQSGEGGIATTTKLITAMNSSAKNPIHTQRRALA